MVDPLHRAHAHTHRVANLVTMAHDRVNRSVSSINRSLGTIQRTRDRIPFGSEVALRIERRYERELQEALAHLSPQAMRHMALSQRWSAASAISAELIEVGLQLLATSRLRLFGPQSGDGIHAGGAPRGQVARGERDGDEQRRGAAERERIDRADAEQEAP